MPYDLNKYSISALDLVNTNVQEVPIDADITLPDYCPDVGKILKCQVYSSVTSRNIAGDRLSIEGVSIIELLYSDLDKNTVRCFKTEIPFSQNFNIQFAVNPEVVTFNIKREYINCRAVSPRRIDVHGAFSIKPMIFGRKNLEVTNDIIADDVKQKKEDVTFSQLNSIIQHQINISETLDVGSDKASPEFIIKSYVSINDIDCTCKDEQISLFGNVNIKILYVNDIETGKMDKIEYDIPISETIDAQGVMDDSYFVIIPEIISHEEKILSDSDMSNLIGEDLKLMFTILSFHDDEMKIISDAYSTDYNLELLNENFNFDKFNKVSCENISHKEVIDSLASKIIDIWEDSSCVTISEKGNLNFKVNICVLSLDSDLLPIYFEREIQFSKEITNINNSNNSKSYFSLSVQKIEYKILSNNSISLKLNLQVLSNICESKSINIVSEVSADDSKKKEKDSSTSLIIYYADAGESLWNIAKNYGTTVEKIQTENEIDFDIIEDNRAILIPTI